MEGQRQVLGSPVEFEYDGKTFAIVPWTFAQEGEFAAWVESRARKRLNALRRELGEDEYRAQMDALRRDADAGLYEWGSKIVADAWSSPAGAKHLAYLTLSKLDRTVTPAWVERLSKDRKAWYELWLILIGLNFPPVDPAPVATEEHPEAATNG